MLLNPQPLSADVAKSWGVVAEVTPDGMAVSRAKELANAMLAAPDTTRRFTRAHFTQPIKERLVKEVSNGLALEGASATALVKQLHAAKDKKQ